MEVLKNVLIKEVGARVSDLVFIVDNLPTSMLYQATPKMKQVPAWALDYMGSQEPKMVADYVLKDEREPDEPRNRKFTHAMTDTLLEGLGYSEVDNGYIFNVGLNEAKARLDDIDRYIRNVVPQTERLPVRVPYEAQPGSMTSGPRPLSSIPRVVLPEPVSPPAQAVQASSTPSLSAPVQAVESAPKPRRAMSEEAKQRARENLRLARERKAQQKATQEVK